MRRGMPSCRATIQTALAQVDQAIAQVPNDTVLHEFRGLVLFALGRYKEAAAADYAVLSAGPGWDWTTLSAPLSERGCLHGATPRLGAVRKIEPGGIGREIPAGRKLPDLRLHRCCRRTAQGQSCNWIPRTSCPPNCSVAFPHRILPSRRYRANRRRLRSRPMRRASWATGPRRVPIAPRSNWPWPADGKFTWALDQKGKPQQFSGTYTVADNLLVLKQGDNPMMVGQVASLASDRFNFKLAGDNPSDPGLTFVR